MEEMLDKLIQEGERLSKTIVYVPPADGVWRLYDAYRTNESSSHKEWLSSTQRFVRLNYEEESVEIDKLVAGIKGSTIKGNHQKILGILKAIKLMPQQKPKENKGPSVVFNNSNSQSQTQEQDQKLVLEIFIESITDKLNGSEIKELKAIFEECKDEPEKAKQRISEKIKSFGKDVASNILANIITNPAVWSAFM